MTYRMLALDIDGTLMDSSDSLRDEVRDAVRRAADAGLEVVLCTGRRYRTALPVLEALGLEGAVILHNGVIVKDIGSGTTIQNHYLEAHIYRRALACIRAAGPPLVYVDAYEEEFDLFCEAVDHCHEFQAEYVEDNLDVTRIVERLDPPASASLVMVCSMADEARLQPVRDTVAGELGDAVTLNLIMNKRYRGHMLEIVSSGASKWGALEGLARERGIESAQIIAIGDDLNDAELVEKSGLGIAMENAVPGVKEVADEVTSSNDESGVARAIDRLGI